FILLSPRPPTSTLFPYTTLFRSPLNEVAIRELKGTPTALDLYTYLAYRLPRIGSDKGQIISWDQLAKHLGNEADSKRFRQTVREDRKSTRLNSSHVEISYAVFCL